MSSASRSRCHDDGFTLIELMIVVLVIAILLAIAIPTFMGARNRSRDRAAQTNLRNAFTAAKTIAADQQGFYSEDDGAPIDGADLAAAEGALAYVDADFSQRGTVGVRVITGGLDPATGGLMAGDSTGAGVVVFGTRSYSGTYYGLCADYRGVTKYFTGTTPIADTGTDCVQARF